MKIFFIILSIIVVIVCYKYAMRKIDRDEADFRNHSMDSHEEGNEVQNPVNDFYSKMTVRQKSAVLDLMSALAGFGPCAPSYFAKVNNLMKTASTYMNISVSEYSKFKQSFGDLDGLTRELKSIKDKNVLDSLFLSFFSVVVKANLIKHYLRY